MSVNYFNYHQNAKSINITYGLRWLLALSDISQSFSQYHQLVVQLTTWR